MRRVLMSVMAIVISGCATQHPPQSFASARQVIQRPLIIQVPEHKTNFRLMYGNDPSLERAFNQYARTGKAPHIITDGFVKFAYNA
jgi:type IV pilus biogenesis protein CpaD/CtpE